MVHYWKATAEKEQSYAENIQKNAHQILPRFGVFPDFRERVIHGSPWQKYIVLEKSGPATDFRHGDG